MQAVRVDQLLRALSTCLHNRNGTRPGCSFLRIWAHLVNARFETVFDFLVNAPDRPGQPSLLEYVISDGFCREYHTFEIEDRKTVKLALNNILRREHDNRFFKLRRINYRGEYLFRWFLGKLLSRCEWFYRGCDVGLYSAQQNLGVDSDRFTITRTE